MSSDSMILDVAMVISLLTNSSNNEPIINPANYNIRSQAMTTIGNVPRQHPRQCTTVPP